jgi:hypothetical protein
VRLLDDLTGELQVRTLDRSRSYQPFAETLLELVGAGEDDGASLEIDALSLISLGKMEDSGLPAGADALENVGKSGSV